MLKSKVQNYIIAMCLIWGHAKVSLANSFDWQPPLIGPLPPILGPIDLTPIMGGDHTVGNGGNAFDDMFYLACERATTMLFRYDSATRPLDEDEAMVHDFIMNNRQNLARDVLRCDLRFSVLEKALNHPEVVESCALTNVDPSLVNDPKVTLDTVYLSRPTCIKEGINEDGAARILIHEAVHHFVDSLHSTRPDDRINDEDFCNLAAKLVFTHWRKLNDQEPRRWLAKPTVLGAPSKRAQHSAVWTGDTGNSATSNKMIVWGGCAPSDDSFLACGQYFNTGAVFDYETNQWQSIPTESAPQERTYHSAVWTGEHDDPEIRHRMLIWGGCRGAEACNESLQSGGIYNPEIPDQPWQSIVIDPETPTARVFHTAVWTEDRMIVWGGDTSYKSPTLKPNPVQDGAAYFPPSQKGGGFWQKISADRAPSARENHSAVWTGEEMIIWGGCDPKGIHYYFCADLKNDGARYNPKTNTWSPMSQVNAPSPRRHHTAVWTGTHMLVWGGEGRNQFENSGAIYDPKSDQWHPMNYIAPMGRSRHIAVWTGTKMIIWGGSYLHNGDFIFPADFGEYYPDPYLNGNDYWKTQNLANHPHPAHEISGIWTGESMIVWGGSSSTDTYFDRGGTYFTTID